MNRKTLIARLRQLQAVDINAHDIYVDLLKLTKDDTQRKIFLSIADDEKRHIALGKKMLSMLEK